jgi:hypothetical protein
MSSLKHKMAAQKPLNLMILEEASGRTSMYLEGKQTIKEK